MNVLTQPVKIGNFNVPAGLLLLLGAALLAVLALNSKKTTGKTDGTQTNAFLGLYDAALSDVANPKETQSFNAPPSQNISPLPVTQIQTPVVTPQTQPQPAVNTRSNGLVAIGDALQRYPQARSLWDAFSVFPNSRGAYTWYDPIKNVLVDDQTAARFYP